MDFAQGPRGEKKKKKKEEKKKPLSDFAFARVTHPLDLNDSTVVLEETAESVANLRDRTLQRPFVTDSPPAYPGIKTSDALKESAIVPSKVTRAVQW